MLFSCRGLRLILGTVLSDIAYSRAEIDQARLLVLSAARQIDLHKAKGALKEIGIAKVRLDLNPQLIHQFMVPTMALKVVDRAMQVYGAEGISQDQPLAYMYAGLRTLRYADVSLSIELGLNRSYLGSG